MGLGAKPAWGIGIASVAWAVLLVVGVVALWRFELGPGASATHPAAWPSASALSRSAVGPTLLVFVHPHCACSRATLSALADIERRHAVRTLIVLVRPHGTPADFAQNGVVDSARAIANAEIVEDVDAIEASRFGALTSGDALLYSAAGQLQFAGGLTEGRGHEGQSIGQELVLAALQSDQALGTTDVFGCELDNPNARERWP